MEQQYIEVQPREETGKGPNRRLRREGLIPGIVYGGDRGPIPISIEERAVWKMLHAETGENTVRMLKVAGTDRKRYVMIKDYQADPITHRILHADFIRVKQDQEVTVSIPVKLIGTPYGVKTEGGMIDFVGREVEVTVKVTEIPAEIELDVSELRIGDSVRIKDLAIENVVFTHDEDTLIVKVEEMRVQQTELETDEEAEGLEEGLEEVAETEATEEAAE